MVPGRSQSHSQSDQLQTNVSVMLLSIAAELILIAATWRLWFAESDFPRVPLFEIFQRCPVGVIRGLSGAFVCSVAMLGLTVLRAKSLPRRLSTLVTVSLGAGAVCCNQHCLQPWHWLFLLILGTRLAVPDSQFCSAVRRIIPWIYIFAAVSRVGPGIDSGMSRQIVVTILDLLGLPLIATRPSVLTALCIFVTLGEFAVGACLLTRRLQKPGMLFAVVMHVSLIVALSPIGLQQETGVLIWNGYLACLAILLWWKTAQRTDSPSFTTRAVSVMAFVWPAMALLGFTHNWTGWQVYSPRPEILQLQIHVDAIGQLPDSLQAHVDPPQALEDWSTVRLDRWCLQETGTPMYPQSHFQLAVAIQATEGIEETKHVLASMSRPESPLWWRRQHDAYQDRSSL